jgi:glycosyltransferase involved in cell wall biosynthesis
VGFYSVPINTEQASKGAQTRVSSFKGRHRPGLLLIGNFLSGSIGNRGVCEDLAVTLTSAGWSVITTSSHPGRLARLFDFLLTVWRQRHNYSVAHVDVYSGLAFVWAELVCRALRLAKKPYVLTLHGGNLPVFARRSDQRVRRLLQSSSAVTAPSRYLLEQMRQYRQDIVLLPNPLDLAKYPFKHRVHHVPNLVWLRAFHDFYNPSLAVRAVALLVNNFPTVQLVMIGPNSGDGSRESMLDLAQKIGVQDRVVCPGQVPKGEISHWLQQGDIFLNTTRVDNTPVSVLEAMACGLCVISTNVGGIPYMLEDEYDALLVPADDPAAMAKAVQRFLTEDGLAERLSGNARRKAEQCDWSNILPRWESLFTDVRRKHTT